MISPTRHGERGQVVVLFALLLPVLLGIGTVVIAIGNWYTHAKHLQTKVDASALAGGGVWGFPCGPDIDDNIEAQARKYVGAHTAADGTVYTSTLNPQVGKVGADKIYTTLNQANWWTGGSFPAADFTDPSGPVCESKILDVKATEDDSFPLFSLIPLFPEIKRKARVQINQIEGLGGVLPISVRVPKPLSAAAVFYDESDGGIIAVKYFCEGSVGWLPSELSGWTTYDPGNPQCNSEPDIGVAPATGVAVALSVRPACDPGASPPITVNCFEDSGFATVNDLCRQGGGRYVECFYKTGLGANQTVLSGLQFIHGYQNGDVTDGEPELRGAWLWGGACTPSGYTSSYFAAVAGSCSAHLTANIDIGTCRRGPGQCYNDPSTTPPVETRTAANTEVKYTLVYGTGANDDVCDFGPSCDLSISGTKTVGASTPTTSPLIFGPDQARYAVGLRIRLKDTFVRGKPGCSNNNFNGQCEWYFIGSGRVDTQPTNATILDDPVQRSFMGDDDRSGPIGALRLYLDGNCDGFPEGGYDNDTASQQLGNTNCFFVEMGLKGAIAQDQDEPPIVFNLKASQSAILDCDPNLPNVKSEIVAGCSPMYQINDFTRDPPCPGLTSWGQMLNPPAPYDTEWPSYTCVLTQTGNPRQILDGFLERLFGQSSPAPSCPAEFNQPAPEWVKGRNYWHDSNNSNNVDPTTGLSKWTFAETLPTLVHGDNLRNDDPRKVKLFMTGYDSFTGTGNELFPIWNFGNFYITGFGTGGPGGGLINEDPCSQGDPSSPGAGNKPPPQIKVEPGGAYVWGHFINNAEAPSNAIPSDEICTPLINFTPCVPVLVE